MTPFSAPFVIVLSRQVQQSDVNHGSVESVLTVEAENPRGLSIEDESDVFVTLEPVSLIELGKPTETNLVPVDGYSWRRELKNIVHAMLSSS